jgi:hypothetical protein
VGRATAGKFLFLARGAVVCAPRPLVLRPLDLVLWVVARMLTCVLFREEDVVHHGFRFHSFSFYPSMYTMCIPLRRGRSAKLYLLCIGYDSKTLQEVNDPFDMSP